AADASGQTVWPYALWSLLVLTIQSDDGDDPLIIPIGIPIAALNIGSGLSANSRARKDFREEHLLGRTMAPGETAYGLLFIRDAAYNPLTFEFARSGS
ncbi:MAG TPA: hypothetical protein VD962_05580, partial [Rubricoccaceae bacterium]|nr:hypothetical protein [Rubricoccaceae bacterium]